MTPELLVSYTTILASGLLSVAFLATVYRVVVGPTLPDRIIALDMLVGIAIGFIAVIAIRTGFNLYVDIAIALGLVGFLATVAFARFVLSRGPDGKRRSSTPLDGEKTPDKSTKASDIGTGANGRSKPKGNTARGRN
ncbi:cation:proton antiporter [Rhizobium sp. RM]|uniref:cation:proton antiporter n=1 Tax=Rhizobium sp. RM TaxID=2748079 RepID=UPI00110DFA6A|nr:cation:proton antiporter [Rhizobium sp. RM]NWJ25195.1 cation:proton antiporter [Rhizobium sp. RM]TMV16956.1 cation:proton antiporter [Rhizobium sp. Td3]